MVNRDNTYTLTSAHSRGRHSGMLMSSTDDASSVCIMERECEILTERDRRRIENLLLGGSLKLYPFSAEGRSLSQNCRVMS